MIMVWVSLSLVFLIVLWGLSKLPGAQEFMNRGLLNLGALLLGRGISRIVKEFVGMVWLLFGKSEEVEDDNQSTWNENSIRRMVSAAIAIDVILVALSFMGSFTASRAYAIEHGISSAVAFAIPLAIDGGVLLCIIITFVMALARVEARKARIGLGILTSVSILFNAAHISDARGVSFSIILLGVIFPVTLFGGTELMIDLIRTQMTRSGTIKSLDELKDEVENLERRKEEVSVQLLEAENQVADAREQYAEVMDQVGRELAARTNGHAGSSGIVEHGGDLRLMLAVEGKDGLTFDEIVERSDRGITYVKTTLRYLMTEGVIVFEEDKFKVVDAVIESEVL